MNEYYTQGPILLVVLETPDRLCVCRVLQGLRPRRREQNLRPSFINRVRRLKRLAPLENHKLTVV